MAKYPTTPMCDGELLERFEPTARDTDIFCATAAKSGQTWLMALMYHLRSKGRDPEMGGVGSQMAVMPWLEIPFDIGGSGEPYERDARLAQLEALQDPRIFKLHVTYDEIPRPTNSKSRVVTITRDPRDLPYSMYCHLRGMGRLESDDEPFDSYFERWMKFGYFFQVVNSFWPHRNEPHVLWLRYEDLKANLRSESERLARFLGWELSDADYERALPLVQMKRMQEREAAARSEQEQSMWKDDARFFREGAVGKNRAQLSADQERRILERARAEFPPECFDFVVSQQ